MNLESFREHCLAKSHVTEGMPFGDDTIVFKVAGKIFALASLEEVPSRVNLKCDPDLALDLRDRYEEVTPGYHMNKKALEHRRAERSDSRRRTPPDDRPFLRSCGCESAEEVGA